MTEKALDDPREEQRPRWVRNLMVEVDPRRLNPTNIVDLMGQWYGVWSNLVNGLSDPRHVAGSGVVVADGDVTFARQFIEKKITKPQL